MGFAELFLIGVGLSMDAFAVSVCKGLNMHGTLNWRDTGLLALFFGGFQALMPLAGWALGRGFEQYITSIPDFPKKGIIFRDITTVLGDADGLHLRAYAVGGLER